MHADKRRKLFDLEAMRRRLPHVSQRGLSATLKDIRKHGLPDLDGTKDLREARELTVNEKTPYGPIGVDKDIPTTGGGSVKVRMASPLALLFLRFCTVHLLLNSWSNVLLSIHRLSIPHGTQFCIATKFIQETSLGATPEKIPCHLFALQRIRHCWIVK